VVTANAHGQDTVTWATFASRHPAKVHEQGSREFFNAQQMKADLTHLVEIRWFPGVLTGMQVIWHDGTTDRTLNIEGPPVNPDGKRRFMLMKCKEAG
jgi:SPP1 family predicted phage head-tail adaptor